MHARNEMSEKKVEREGVVRGGECEGGEVFWSLSKKMFSKN